MTSLFCLISLLICCLALASPSVTWINAYGGPDLDYGYALTSLGDEGFALAGMSTSNTGYSENFWLLKCNANGDLIWERTYGGPEAEFAYSLCENTLNGFGLVGFTDSFGAGGRDAWVVVTDHMGDTLWTKTVGLSGDDEGRSIIQTSDGAYAITGYTTSSETETRDVLLTKFDSSGNILWSRSFGGDQVDCGLEVIETSDGGFLIGGYFGAWQPGDDDVWLIKTDNQGILEWDARFGDFDQNRGYSITERADGNFLVAGYTSYEYQGNPDIWIICTDNTGNLLWEKSYGGLNSDYATHCTEAWEGGFALSATTSSYGAGSNDLWLLKTDSVGDTLWTMTVGGSGWDQGYWVEQTQDGGFLLAGCTRSYGSGSSDAIVVKISPDTGIETNPDTTSPFGLVMANPTPAGRSAKIEYYLPAECTLDIRLYDLMGREVEAIFHGHGQQGFHCLEWVPAVELTPGCYHMHLNTPNGGEVLCLTILN